MSASTLARPAAPRPLEAPSYVVGQDDDGRWVVVEARGMAGGIFRSRGDAIRYASVEAGCRPGEVRVAAGPVRFRLA